MMELFSPPKCPHCGSTGGVLRVQAKETGGARVHPDCDLIVCGNIKCSAIIGTVIPKDLQAVLQKLKKQLR